MAEKILNVVPEEIHLIQVNVIKSNINTEEKYLDHPVVPEGMSIELGKDIAYNFEEGGARYRLYFKFEGLSKDNEAIGLNGDIGLEYHFMIDEFEKHVKKTKKGNELSLPLCASMMAIAYSTSRGIILERTQNTFFKGIILPVLDSTKFLLEDEKSI